MPDPEISIVIVSWNVRDQLRECLLSMQHHVRTPHEVIVVDNHSADGIVDMLRQEWPNVRVIANDHNAGFARANNQGWQMARGSHICFLNPDTIFINDPFPTLVAVASQEHVGAVAPKLLNLDRSVQASVRRFPRLLDQLFILIKLRWLANIIPALNRYYHGSHGDDIQAVDQVMGAAMLIPRRVLNDAGSFDEGYWIWFEEVDLCRRLHQRGLRVMYVPTAQIIHLGGQSFAQHVSLAKHVWFLKSLTRYARKYWSPVAVAILYILLPISYTLTMLQSLVKPR